MQQTADNVNQAKRSSTPDLISSDTRASSIRQGVNCVRTFASGFPHQTPPPTITWPVPPVTKERQRGSFKAVPSKNGSPQVRFFGYMVNVCHSIAIHIIPPDSPLSVSWLREECTLVRRFLTLYLSKIANVISQFRNHPRN
jgi:hypothetical protein